MGKSKDDTDEAKERLLLLGQAALLMKDALELLDDADEGEAACHLSMAMEMIAARNVTLERFVSAAEAPSGATVQHPLSP